MKWTYLCKWTEIHLNFKGKGQRSSFIQLQQVSISKCHCSTLESLLALHRNLLISSSSLKMTFFCYRKEISEVKKRKKKKKSFASLNRSVGGVHKYQKSTGAPARCPYFSLIGYNVWVKEGPWTKRSLLNWIFFVRMESFDTEVIFNGMKRFKFQSKLEQAFVSHCFLVYSVHIHIYSRCKPHYCLLLSQSHHFTKLRSTCDQPVRS